MRSGSIQPAAGKSFCDGSKALVVMAAAVRQRRDGGGKTAVQQPRRATSGERGARRTAACRVVTAEERLRCSGGADQGRARSVGGAPTKAGVAA